MNRYFAYILMTVFVFLTSCTTDDETMQNTVNKKLIGRSVSFAPTVDDVVTRTNQDGFNDNDSMIIYRQEYNGTGYNAEDKWVQYKYVPVRDASGNEMSRNWNVDVNAYKYRSTTEKQTLADSICWENGNPVRFRAWSKSYLFKYNDYLYAENTSVAGPVESVPLQFKHLGCRVGFIPRESNYIMKVDMCLDVQYYKDITGGLTAQQQVDEVTKVWNTVCAPGGVEMYSNCDNNGYEWGTTTPVSERTPKFGGLMALPKTGTTSVRGGEATADNTARPAWRSLDGTYFSVFCPYNLSQEHYGEAITLPPYTRFAIYLEDINNGDVAGSTSKTEGKFHTFSIGELKKSDGTLAYPNGLTLQSGYSYMFYAGYDYKILTVTPLDNFSWTDIDKGSLTAISDNASTGNADYSWWQNATNAAAEHNYAISTDEDATNNNDIWKPDYQISTVAEWKSFVNLVNGTLPENGIAYRLYTPQNGQTSPTITDAVLNGAYDFSGCTIKLIGDIDFKDEEITSIGTSEHPFTGSFNGQLYTISNGNFTNEKIFGVVSKGTISPTIGHLRIKGTKNTTFVGNAASTYLYSVYMTGPSNCALANALNGCVVVGCAHIGTGNANGPLIAGGNGNVVESCFIAASPNGYIGGGTNSKYRGCYYDKTLTPSYTGLGSNITSDEFYRYYVRGVNSPVLKAKYEYEDKNNTGKYNVYYGLAPWMVMNGQNQAATGTHFEMPSRNNDQYPVMVTGKPTSTQIAVSPNTKAL